MNTTNCIDTIDRTFEPETAVTAPQTWAVWLKTGLTLMVRDLKRMLDLLYDWQVRENQRRQLMTLDDRMLQDIGINRVLAEQEYNKPFYYL